LQKRRNQEKKAWAERLEMADVGLHVKQAAKRQKRKDLRLDWGSTPRKKGKRRIGKKRRSSGPVDISTTGVKRGEAEKQNCEKFLKTDPGGRARTAVGKGPPRGLSRGRCRTSRCAEVGTYFRFKKKRAGMVGSRQQKSRHGSSDSTMGEKNKAKNGKKRIWDTGMHKGKSMGTEARQFSGEKG